MLEEILSILNGVIALSNTLFSTFLLYMNIVFLTIIFPNEIAMFIVGFLIATGKLDFFTLVGTVVIANSSIAFLYYTLSIKMKKTFFSKSKNWNKANIFFKNYGAISVFLSRLVPGVRVYISFIAGVAEMQKMKFLTYTFYGYFVLNVSWCSAGYVSSYLIKDLEEINFENFIFYSLIIVGIFLILFYSSKKILEDIIK